MPSDPFRFTRALQLFPTVVFQRGLPAPLADDRSFEAAVRARRPPGHVGVWQSAPDLHRDAAFAPLVDAVLDSVHAANRALRYAVEGVRITGMWANHLPTGAHHPVHAHANNFWSGAIFLHNDDPDARLVFLHPNPAARAILPSRTASTMANATNWNLPAEPGTLVLFPSWLQHHVPPVARGDRVSIAFNVALVGDLLGPESLQWSNLR